MVDKITRKERRESEPRHKRSDQKDDGNSNNCSVPAVEIEEYQNNRTGSAG